MDEGTCPRRNFYYAGATRDQYDLIGEGRLASGLNLTDDERRWYGIWDILFRGACQPDSPYYAGRAFCERLRYTLQSVTDGDQLESILQQYPPENRGLLEGFSRLLLDAVQRHGNQQDAEGGRTTSQATSQPTPLLMTPGPVDFDPHLPSAPLEDPEPFSIEDWPAEMDDSFINYSGDQFQDDAQGT